MNGFILISKYLFIFSPMHITPMFISIFPYLNMYKKYKIIYLCIYSFISLFNCRFIYSNFFLCYFPIFPDFHYFLLYLYTYLFSLLYKYIFLYTPIYPTIYLNIHPLIY